MWQIETNKVIQSINSSSTNVQINQQQLEKILMECQIQSNKLSAISHKSLPLFVQVEQEQRNIEIALNKAIKDYKNQNRNQVTEETFILQNETQIIER